jgi:hypothetical protein
MSYSLCDHVSADFGGKNSEEYIPWEGVWMGKGYFRLCSQCVGCLWQIQSGLSGLILRRLRSRADFLLVVEEDILKKVCMVTGWIAGWASGTNRSLA